MLLSRLFLIFSILFVSYSATAQTNLTQIRHAMIGDNKYRVTFVLDKNVDYKVTPENRILVDFVNTEFAVKTISHKLDARFLKAILKSNKVPDNLNMILELAEPTKFDKTYSVLQDGKLFVTIELSNDKLLPSSVEANPPVLNKEKDNKPITIMIDAGHGGIDQGAAGANTIEKNITLAYAKELRKELRKYPQYKVVMSRDKDVYISKEERKELIRKMKADLFISIHVDSNSDSNLHGASIYTLSQDAMEQESSNLSERKSKKAILKNEELLQQNKDIANVLINMVYQDTQNASIKLAKDTTEALSKQITMLQKPCRSAELRVLKGVDTPAILVELGYLSNAAEEKLLNTVMHRKLFTQSLIQGINKYTNEYGEKRSHP